MLVTKEMPDAKGSSATIALPGRSFLSRAFFRGKLFLRALVRYAPILVVLTLARSTLADQYHVPTSSMWPTIEPGDRIFVEKIAYGLRVPFTNWYLIDAGGPKV